MSKFKSPHALALHDAAIALDLAHRRYEYVRCLNVAQFKCIFQRCLKGERFDDVIDACIAGCPPNCREGKHSGCAICMSPRE